MANDLLIEFYPQMAPSIATDRKCATKTSTERINAVCLLFNTTAMNSLSHAEIQLQIQGSTIQEIVKQLLSLYLYKIQEIQEITASDRLRRPEFVQHALTQS